MQDAPNIFAAADQSHQDQGPRARSYLNDFQDFMEKMRTEEVSGREIGEMIMNMAAYFMQHNLIMVRSLKIYTKIKSEIQSHTDEMTGKPITSAKAEMLAAATPEGFAYEEARVHLQNIQEGINALKAFQRGAINEYTNQ